MSNFLIVSILFLGMSVSTSWLVSNKEMDNLTQQLEETTAAKAVLAEEVDALKEEMTKREKELASVRERVVSLKKVKKMYKAEIEGLQGELERETERTLVLEEKYGRLEVELKALEERETKLKEDLETALQVKTEIEKRFNAIKQRGAELEEELETAYQTKSEIEKRLRNEERLRKEAQETVARLEHDIGVQKELLTVAEGKVSGVLRERKGEGEWWREEVIMYRVKERDTLTKIAARDFAFGDGEQWRRIYNCNFDVTHNPDVIYPNQVLLIPPLKIVRAAGADEMKEVPRKVSPEKKKPLKKVRREGRWAIHIGSYLYRSEADRVAMILRSGGDNAYITEFDSKGTHWYRVRVGFFASKQEAASYAQELSTQLKEQDLWVVLPSRREVTSFRDRIKKEDLNNI